MKRLSLLLLTVILLMHAKARNVGVGTSIPLMQLHVSSETDSTILLLEKRAPFNSGSSMGCTLKTDLIIQGQLKLLSPQSIPGAWDFLLTAIRLRKI